MIEILSMFETFWPTLEFFFKCSRALSSSTCKACTYPSAAAARRDGFYYFSSNLLRAITYVFTSSNRIDDIKV